MKPYLFGQDVFHFVDDLVSCPPSHVSDGYASSSSTNNPSFFSFEATRSTYFECITLFSLSVDVLHLMVDCHTSQCIWRTLKKAFTSSSNSRII